MNKIMYVQWKDHWGSAEHGWQNYDDIDVKDLAPLLIESVGWIRYETDEVLVIVPHWHYQDSDQTKVRGQGDLCILKNCIVKKKQLKI